MKKLEVIGQEKFLEIHDASLKILEETGVVFHHETALSIFKHHGAKVEDQLVKLNRKLVEKALAQVPGQFSWKARNASYSRVLGDGYLLQPAAGTVKVHDLDGIIREGTLEDYTNFQKIYQFDEIFDLVGMIPVEPKDVDQQVKHLLMMYEILKHTNKPVNGFMTTGNQAKAQLDMMEIAVGGKKEFEDNHYMAVSIGVTTPLTYSWDPLETLIHYVRRNQVPTILSAPLAGVTSPYSLLGTAVLQNAEILAGIVLTQLIQPRHPVVYCPSATVANMKTAGFSTGAPEGMLINIANIQMGTDFYKIPVRTMAGLTDAKVPDFQAGVETMQNLMMGMLSGAHLLNESVGILDNILTVSYEKTILDGETISRIKRINQGIRGVDQDLCIDAIQGVGHSGSYLTDPMTVQNCRQRWTPTSSFWGNQQDWENEGALPSRQRANQIARQILAEAPDSLIDQALDQELKSYITNATKNLDNGPHGTC